jgi:hypothetical protein
MSSKYHLLHQVHIDDEIDAKLKREEKIQKILQQCSKYVSYKIITSADNPCFVHFLASLIENSNLKKYHIDKLQVFIDVVKILFPLTEQEVIKKIVEILEYLLKTKQIKKIPILQRSLHLAYLIIKDVSINFFLPIKTETNGKK